MKHLPQAKSVLPQKLQKGIPVMLNGYSLIPLAGVIVGPTQQQPVVKSITPSLPSFRSSSNLT